MAQLAIKGHTTRGEEVIKILEMLGGVNSYKISASKVGLLYTIRSHDNFIIGVYPTSTFVGFTLEDFLEKYPYKVGDKVTLDKFPCKIEGMSWEYDDIIYYVKGADFSKGVYSKDKTLQPYKEETMETITIDDFKANTKEWLIDKLESMSKDNALQAICNIHDELHKSEYPKTYEECCKVLGWNQYQYDRTGYCAELLCKLQVILLCRDAYWKIAGEQMELGKSWEPDWVHATYTYTIICRSNNIVKDSGFDSDNRILAFPTKEMRDAFYENFKELIKQCKELL